jgi:hypothetical protein
VNTIDELRAALNYPPSQAAPDTAAIIARGRRQRVARRAVLGTGLAAVATIAAVATVAATSPTGHAPRGQDSPGAVPNPILVAANTSTAAAPTRFDPLVRTLHVGWLPGGLKDQQAEVTTWSQSYGAKDEAYVNGGRDIGLVVDVLAKGRPVGDFSNGALGLPLDAVPHATEPINGRPAECLSDPSVPGSCAALRWQYAPGAWARVSYAGSAGQSAAAAAAVARKVAESVSLTSGEPVRMPFTISGKIGSMHPARTLVDIYENGATGLNGERWFASIELVENEKDLQGSDTLRRSVLVEVIQRPSDPSGRIERDDKPNTTVDGYPAWLRPDGGALVVWGVHKTRADVEYQNRPGNAKAAYTDVHVLPKPDDPAAWVSSR